VQGAEFAGAFVLGVEGVSVGERLRIDDDDGVERVPLRGLVERVDTGYIGFDELAAGDAMSTDGLAELRNGGFLHRVRSGLGMERRHEEEEQQEKAHFHLRLQQQRRERPDAGYFELFSKSAVLRTPGTARRFCLTFIAISNNFIADCY
jgi:hypothetical protein